MMQSNEQSMTIIQQNKKKSIEHTATMPCLGTEPMLGPRSPRNFWSWTKPGAQFVEFLPLRESKAAAPWGGPLKTGQCHGNPP